MFTSITFALQSIFCVFAFLCLLIFSYSLGDSSNSSILYFITFLANVLVILVLNIFKKKINKNLNFLIVNFLFIWIIIIIIGTIPLFEIYENSSLSEIFFISTSLSTTTGLRLSDTILQDNDIFLMWHAILQFIGANYSILTYLLFFSLILKKENKAFFLNKKSIIIFNLIFFLFLLVFSFLLFFINSNFIQNLTTASAILSSGGFADLNNSILNDKFSNNNTLIFLMLLMLISLLFLPLFAYFIDRSLFKKFYRKFSRRISFLLFIMIGLVLFVAFYGKLSFIENLFLGVSFLTTTGMLPHSFESPYFVNSYSSFVLVFIIFMIIGTFSGTSNGGLKIDKLSIIVIKITEELNRFIFQHNLKGIEIIKKGSNQRELNSLYVLIAVGSIFTLISVLCHNIIGYSVKDSFFLSISALTNTGEGIIFLSKTPIDNEKNIYFILNFLMICGRFENIGYLLIFARLFKKN